MDKVLFIQLSRLGDCLQSTPLLASWHQHCSNDQIYVLVRPEYAAVFERNPDVAETIIFDPPVSSLSDDAIDPIQCLSELKGWLEALKKRRFRSVVNLTHDPFSCWMATALETREICGLYYDRSGRMRTRDPWGLYTFSLLKFRKANLFNIVDSYAHLCGKPSTVSSPVFPLDPESVRLAEEWLSECEPGCCIIGFQPGANLPERRWPAENFISIGRSLASDGIRLIVFGSKSEETLGREIAQNVPGGINFAGKTTIPQLAALLARCAVLVTNDTGTMHVGTAVGTRILALFESSAYFRETGPYGAGHWIIQYPQLLEYGQKSADELAGIRRIPPEEVLWAVRELLSEVREKKSTRSAEPPPNLRALHFRSVWDSGHLNFYPARPMPLDSETLCSYLQKAVWLATLDGLDLPAEEAERSVLDYLRQHYTIPADAEIALITAGAQAEVDGSLAELKRMKHLLQSCLEKVRRNPKHVFPQEQLAELTRLERLVLQDSPLFSLHGFLGYFVVGLAMVGADSTREYLEQYLRPVVMLERQLFLFGKLLAACR
jgi:ADP-heptose:LPS heptosyltransferase